MKKVIIFGTGQFAKIIHQYLANDSDIEVIAFTANENYIKDDSFCGLPVVPFEKVLQASTKCLLPLVILI